MKLAVHTMLFLAAIVGLNKNSVQAPPVDLANQTADFLAEMRPTGMVSEVRDSHLLIEVGQERA